MIPKTIHYCWFGRGQKPKDVIDYIATWRLILPDYKIKEWNEKNFNYKEYRYTYEAYRVKKYAFVSDVCRLYALYNEGGIYLDTDIEVIKSFNSFLSHSSFVGFEVENLIGTGVIGAEPNTQWIKTLLNQYECIDFVNRDGILNMYANTQRITKLFLEDKTINKPYIYSLDVLCAKDWRTKEILQTKNTVAIHHYKASWTDNNIHPLEALERKICSKLHISNHHYLIRSYRKIVKFICPK